MVICELTIDVEYTNLYKGVDPQTVKGITNYLGSLYDNYSNDPIEKLTMIAMCLLACAQFFVKDVDHLWIALDWLMQRFNI